MALNLNENDIERFNSVLGTMNSSMLSSSKSSEARRIAEQSLIKNIMRVTGAKEDEARQIVKTIRTEEEREKKREQREKAMAEGVKSAIGGLKDFFGGAVQSTQALYNADSAFTGVIPTLQLIGNTFKAISGAIATFTSGLPFFGAIFSAADKAVGVVVDIGVSLLTAQLENAAKVIENFNSISKAGMSFGGSLIDMQAAAVNSGMSIGTFGKFVTSNIENLAAMGGALQRNTKIVGDATRSIAAVNPSLLAIYGSMDGLGGAVADYMARLSGYGVDITKLNSKQQASVNEYLIQQKELTALTGKSAETLKKQEEERRKNAIYQMRLARLDDEQALNVSRNIEIFGKSSKEAGDFATEVFNTQGNVTSRQALLFQQQFPELAETILKTQADAQTMNAAEFREQQSKYVASRADLLKAEAQRYEDLYQLSAGGVKNEYIDQINRTASGTLSAFAMLRDLSKTYVEEQQNRSNIAKGAGAGVADTITQLERYKQDTDARTVGLMGATKTIVDTLIKFNTLLNDKVVGPATEYLTNNLADLINKILNLAAEVRDAGTGTGTGTGQGNNNPAGDTGVNTSENLVNPVNNNTTALNNNTTALNNHGQSWLDRMILQNEQNRGGTNASAVGGNFTPSATSGARVALPFKSPEATAGGPTHPVMQRLLEGIATKNNNFIINGINDMAHRTPGHYAYNPRSPHLGGTAADIKPGENMSMKDLEKLVRKEMEQQGVTGEVRPETDKKSGSKYLHVRVNPEEHSALDPAIQGLLDRVDILITETMRSADASEKLVRAS
jgi:hypothetical protein